MYQIPDFTLNQKTFTLTFELATADDLTDKEFIIKGGTGKMNQWLDQSCKLIYQKSNLKENGLLLDDLQDLPFTTLQGISQAILGSEEIDNIIIENQNNGFLNSFDISFYLKDGKQLEIVKATKLSARKYKLYADKLSVINANTRLTEQKIKDYYSALASILKNETNLINNSDISQKDIYDKTPILVLDKICSNFIIQEDLNIEKKTE